MALAVMAVILGARPAAAQCPRYEVYAEIDAASCDGTVWVRGWSPKNDYICGSISCAAGNNRAFVWWGEGESIEILEMPPGTWESEALDVNDAGIVVGRVGISGSGYTEQAFRYDRATKQVSLLPPPADGNDSIATSITEQGLIGGYLVSGHGFLWLWDTDTVWSIEPMLTDAGWSSWVQDMSNSGFVAGHHYPPDAIVRRVFRLHLPTNEYRMMEPPPGSVSQEGQAVNSEGRVAGWFRLPDPDAPLGYVVHAFTWDGVGRIDFPPPAGFIRALCFDIAEDGTLAMNVDNIFNGSTAAIGRDGRIFLLRDLVANPPGPTIRTAWLMHEDGRIAAHVRPSLFDTNMVLLRPIEPVLGDATCDGRVGFDDLVDVLAAWSRCDDGFADVDRSGCVDLSDLELVIAAWDGG